MQDIYKTVSEGATEWLNDLRWHDSVLYDVRLVRISSADEVVLELDLVSDWENGVCQRARLTFTNCYLVDIHLDWGIKCISDGEMIANAKSMIGGALVNRVKDEWNELKGINLPQLAEFHLELSSTDSEVALVFGAVTFHPYGDPLHRPLPTDP